MQTFALTIQKAPGGGYAMAFAVDGAEASPGEAFAYSSHLHEIFERLVLPQAQAYFKEAPLNYGRMPPLAMPPPLPEPASHERDPDMPAVIQRYAGNGHPNGHLASVLVGCLAGAWLWASVAMTGLGQA